MNAEELKMILDTVKSVADTAGVAGITWVVIHYVVQLAGVIVGPVCLVIGAVKVAGYIARCIRDKADTASADELERTKQRQIELEKVKADLAGKTAIQQLVSIANAANVRCSEYSGIYSSDDFTKIRERVKGLA